MSDYLAAEPYPHAVIDGFLPEDMAESALRAFPNADDDRWMVFTGNGKAEKREMADIRLMPKAVRTALSCANLRGKRLARMFTGLNDLECDPTLYGGGLNLVEPGGFLAPHADFNFRDGLGYRTVNLLVYLNKSWKQGDGGELELWDGDEVAKRIEPIFNRAVIFTTTGTAIHGYGPVKRTRRSMNLYFYRKTAAPGIAVEPHRTLWADKPMEHAQ